MDFPVQAGSSKSEMCSRKKMQDTTVQQGKDQLVHSEELFFRLHLSSLNLSLRYQT